MSLKQHAISGFFWGAINNFSVQIVQFVVGLVLARLLDPEDFGLVGLLTVFMAISSSLTDGGFTAALIRKKNCTHEDYSTVFIFNLLISLSIYLILFFSSNTIANYFERNELSMMLKILALKIVLDALSITQIAKVTRELNFKFQAKISLATSIFSGIVGIVCALRGMGAWSLILQYVSFSLITSLLFFFLSSWKPTFTFSKKSFKEMFGFGVKLLGSSLLGKIFNEFSTFLIGKYLSFSDLGFYTRANMFKNLPSQTINTILTKVSYPLLSKFGSDLIKLKQNYRKLIKVTTFISFVIMGLMAATADDFIIILIGEKWTPSIVLFQMLSVVGMIYPLQALNLNILNVIGRSDIHLKLTFIKNIISLPILFGSLYFGLKGVVTGLVIISFVHLFINMIVSGKFIKYTMLEQLKDIYFQTVVIIIISSSTYCINIFDLNIYLSLITKILLFVLLLLSTGELFKIYSYLELKHITLNLLKIKK